MRKSKQMKEKIVEKNNKSATEQNEKIWLDLKRKYDKLEVDPNIFYSDVDAVALQFKHAIDLHDIFHERLLDITVTETMKHGDMTQEQMMTLQRKGSLMSNWNRDWYIDEKVDRARN